MKIAIAVHGRFHAFDLARELLLRGHDVTLFPNYPKFVTQRFGVPKSSVKSFWAHWGASHIAEYLPRKGLLSCHDSWLNRVFGHWVALIVIKENWDVLVGWSRVGRILYIRRLQQLPSKSQRLRAHS